MTSLAPDVVEEVPRNDAQLQAAVRVVIEVVIRGLYTMRRAERDMIAIHAARRLMPIITRLIAEAEARATKAETERCAGVASNPGFVQARDTEWDAGFNDAKRRIAAAIRQGRE